ncbi:MAG: NUDIX hydrolase [Desulfotomaculaceae bacterium]
MPKNKATDSETVFQGRIVDVRRDKVLLPDGRSATMEIVSSSDATAVVAITADRKVLLINQFRYAAGGMLLEIPAGKMEPGESPKDCAGRELEEETGFRPGTLRQLVSFYTSPGFCTEKIHLYLAGDLTRYQQNLDQDEFIEVIDIPLDEALAKVDRGEITDAKTIVGLLMAHRIINHDL